MAIFKFGNFHTYLVIFSFGNFQFCQLFKFWQLNNLAILKILAILPISILATLDFGNLQFWQLPILKLAIWAIFKQNVWMDQQQHKQHINIMHLAIKNLETSGLKLYEIEICLIPTKHNHFLWNLTLKGRKTTKKH